MRIILKYIVWSQLLLACSVLLTSCGEDALTDLIMGGGRELPAGATPTEEFSPGNVAPEPMAQDAALFIIDDLQCPYYSVELFGDGNCILVPRSYLDYNRLPAKQPAAKVTRQADGSVVVSELNVMCRPETRDGDTSCTGGTYHATGPGSYMLSFNNGENFLLEISGDNTYIMTYPDGNRTSTVICNKEPVPGQMSESARSICRTWDTLYWDFWLVYKDKARIHVNYNADTGTYSGDVDDGYYDDDDNGFEYDATEDTGMMAYKVTFSPNGTYVCYFRNPETGIDMIDVRKWYWENPAQGILYWNVDNGIDSGTNRGYVTVRFAGNMMRIYEQYTDTQSGMKCEMFIVNTLRASE